MLLRRKKDNQTEELSDAVRNSRIDELEASREQVVDRLEWLMQEISKESGVRWLRHRRFKRGHGPNTRRQRPKRMS